MHTAVTHIPFYHSQFWSNDRVVSLSLHEQLKESERERERKKRKKKQFFHSMLNELMLLVNVVESNECLGSKL